MRVITDGEDRETWLEARKQFVCASDMPHLIEGMDGGYPKDLVALKLGTTEPEVRHPKAEAKAEWGHRHEQSIAKKFTEETGLRTFTNQCLCAHDKYPIAATIDFDILTSEEDDFLNAVFGGILECKTAYASRAARFRKDELPQDVVIQIQTQMLVSGRGLAFCAWLLDGWDFGYKEVPRDEALIDLITKIACTWHAKYIEGKTE